jgi:NADPH:quinone reductase-like Zn-dependent oxidoreductase
MSFRFLPDNAEVRLRVKAIGLNRAEVHFRQGRYRFPPVLPSKIGYEASGIVEAVGRDVNRSCLGKTVRTLPAFPANKYGVYGESRNRSSDSDCRVPRASFFRRGTSIWMQYLTAYGALIREGKLLVHYCLMRASNARAITSIVG